MSRNTLYKDKRLLVIGGNDHAVGKFLQMFDKQMTDATPEGEGLIYDWSEMFGVETNFTGYSDTWLPDTIINNYIEENFET